MFGSCILSCQFSDLYFTLNPNCIVTSGHPAIFKRQKRTNGQTSCKLPIRVAENSVILTAIYTLLPVAWHRGYVGSRWCNDGRVLTIFYFGIVSNAYLNTGHIQVCDQPFREKRTYYIVK